MFNLSSHTRNPGLGAPFARWQGPRTRGLSKTLALASIVAAAGVSSASAETLLMPDRDYLKGASEVVWGISTLPNGSAYTLDYGDGSAAQAGSVGDRSYIAFNHTYASAGTFTVKLTVGAEVATATVRVFDGAVITAADLRGLKINKAIQDGLRYLWVGQGNRTTFDTNPVTWWDASYPRVGTSLVVLAYENHGFKVPNNGATPTGIYPKYLVQRGLNYLFQNLATATLTPQAAGSPCVNVSDAPPNCTGLYNPDSNPGYGTSIAALAIMGSGAFTRTVQPGLAGATGAYLAGKTYAEVAQRLMNTVAWGQIDVPGCTGRGGWYYSLTNGCTTSDGSTVGWNVLSLLDAGASGVPLPAWVSTEFAFALASHGNSNGSFDYNADNNPASRSYPNVSRAGIYLQGLFYQGVPLADSRVTNAISYINARWGGGYIGDDYTGTCSGTQNKGCAYSMYNVFKGLKLYGVSSIGAASDWYGEYEDWLVANQTSPTNTSGGYWGSMQFSCCHSSVPFNAAIAELILAPVALIAPDPDLFSSVGLSPLTATNPLGTNHTVVALAQAAGGAPVPGVTISFKVLTGPNANATGSGTTGADGKVSFTYADSGGWGTDTIQAWIGAIGSNTPSNVVSKKWHTECDVTHDGKVTSADLLAIRNKSAQSVATGDNWQYDANGDGKIDVADVRYCQLRLTP